jgi:hypothetical protein
MKIDRSLLLRGCTKGLLDEHLQQFFKRGLVLGRAWRRSSSRSRLAQNGPRNRENTAWIRAFFEPK